MKTARSRSKVQHLLSFSKKIGLKSQIEDAFDEEEAGRVIKYTLKLPEVRRTLRGKRYRILRCFSDTLKSSINTDGDPAIYAYKPADAIAPVKA